MASESQRFYTFRLRFGPFMAFLSILYSSISGTVTVGAIIMFLLALVIISSSSRLMAIVGACAGIVAIVYMSILTQEQFNLFESIIQQSACASYSSNSTLTSVPTSIAYPTLESYGVNFYGDELSYDEAGTCIINEYHHHTRCYCADIGGSCTTYSQSFIHTCSSIVSSSYHRTIESNAIIAIVSVIYLFLYIILDIYYIRSPAVEYDAPTLVQASQGTPTTATYVKPTVVIVNSSDGIALIDSSSFDVDSTIDFNQNSFFGSNVVVAVPANDHSEGYNQLHNNLHVLEVGLEAI